MIWQPFATPLERAETWKLLISPGRASTLLDHSKIKSQGLIQWHCPPALSDPMGQGDLSSCRLRTFPEPVGPWSARTGIRQLPRPSDGQVPAGVRVFCVVLVADCSVTAQPESSSWNHETHETHENRTSSRRSSVDRIGRNGCTHKLLSFRVFRVFRGGNRRI